MTRQQLCIWLNNWPIQRVQSGPLADGRHAARPTEAIDDEAAARDADSHSGQKRPLILWHTDPRRGRLVIARCAQAARLGIRPRMPIAEACELAESQTGSGPASPLILPHNVDRDEDALTLVASKVVQHISPMVAIVPLEQRPWAGQELAGHDSIVCDLEGVVHLFGNVRNLTRSLHRCLGDLGLNARIAIADNAAAAWAHAHYNRAEDFIASPCQEDAAIELRALSVYAMRLETTTVETLGRLGVTTIGGVLDLPRSGLVSRLGQKLVDRIAQILGETEEALTMFHSPQEYSESLDLEYPTEDQEILSDRFERLVQSLIASLAASQRGALRLACRLDLSGHSQLEFGIGLFSPSLDKKHLICLINMALETKRLRAPVSRVSLSIPLTGEMSSTQSSLFGDQMQDELDGQLADAATGDLALGRLIDTLSGRLGQGSVTGIKLSENPLPESAYELVSLTDHSKRKRRLRKPTSSNSTRPAKRRESTRTGNEIGGVDHSESRPLSPMGGRFRFPQNHDPGRRPVRLLNHPTPISAVSISNQSTTRPSRLPDAFRLGGRIHRVVHFQGPERIETAWWQGPSIRRDYFVVQTDTGRRWWVFRVLGETSWYLHGHFG